MQRFLLPYVFRYSHRQPIVYFIPVYTARLFIALLLVIIALLLVQVPEQRGACGDRVRAGTAREGPPGEGRNRKGSIQSRVYYAAPYIACCVCAIRRLLKLARPNERRVLGYERAKVRDAFCQVILLHGQFVALWLTCHFDDTMTSFRRCPRNPGLLAGEYRVCDSDRGMGSFNVSRSR